MDHPPWCAQKHHLTNTPNHQRAWEISNNTWLTATATDGEQPTLTVVRRPQKLTLTTAEWLALAAIIPEAAKRLNIHPNFLQGCPVVYGGYEDVAVPVLRHPA